jgi:hypothetical protein
VTTLFSYSVTCYIVLELFVYYSPQRNTVKEKPCWFGLCLVELASLRIRTGTLLLESSIDASDVCQTNLNSSNILPELFGQILLTTMHTLVDEDHEVGLGLRI